MIKIDVRTDVSEVRRQYKLLRTDQIPFAAATAINDVMKSSIPAVQDEMRRDFDKPTSWTLNSYRILQWANKRNLTGIIGFKDMEQIGGRGTPAGQYLQPHMDGGPRRAKGLEVALRSIGMLAPGEFLVPSRFQPLDQYGNVPKGTVQKIMANLRANRFDAHSNTPSGGARGGKKKAEYFWHRRGGGTYSKAGGQMTGVWRRTPAGNAIPAFIVVQGSPKYKKRFDPHAVVMREQRMKFRPAFEAAYVRAVATAK